MMQVRRQLVGHSFTANWHRLVLSNFSMPFSLWSSVSLNHNGLPVILSTKRAKLGQRLMRVKSGIAWTILTACNMSL